MPNITPTNADLVYGPSIHHRYDYYRHSVRDAGGNPCIILRHPGGWNAGDKRDASRAGNIANDIAWGALQKLQATDMHCDVISVETRQALWNTPTAGATYGFAEPLDRPSHFPENFEDLKLAVVSIKSQAKSLGIDPQKLVLVGMSAGATMAWWSQLTAPMVANGRSSVDTYTGDASTAGGYDSRVRAVVAIAVPTDFRVQPGNIENYDLTTFPFQSVFGRFANAYVTLLPAKLRAAASVTAYYEAGETQWHVPTMVVAERPASVAPITGCTYTASTLTFTKAGAFNDFVTGDSVRLFADSEAYVDAGIGLPRGYVTATAIPGVYSVASSTANTVVLNASYGPQSVVITGASSGGAGYELTAAGLSSYNWNEGDICWISGGTNVVQSNDTAGQGAGAYTVIRKIDATTIQVDKCFQRGSVAASSVNFTIFPRQFAGDLASVTVQRVPKKPYQNPHDDQQYSPLVDALRKCGLEGGVSFDAYVSGWNAANTERVLQFVKNRISEKPQGNSVTNYGSAVT